VADPEPGCLNRLAGHCGIQRYLGSTVRYDFHLAGTDRPLLAESPQVAEQAIAIPPERLRLLDQ